MLLILFLYLFKSIEADKIWIGVDVVSNTSLPCDCPCDNVTVSPMPGPLALVGEYGRSLYTVRSLWSDKSTFEMILWTFYVNKFVEISTRGYKLDIFRNQSVHAFSLNLNRKVKFIPVNVGVIFPWIITFDGGFCSLHEISKADFKGLRRLQALYLHYNEIDGLGMDVFEEIPEVAYIDLTHNLVSFLPLTIFDTLLQLRYIALGENRLTTIRRDIFIQNQYLMSIFLQKNLISKMEVFHKHLKHLEKVKLTGNLCISESYDARNLTKLEGDVERKCKGGQINEARFAEAVN